MLNDPLRVDRKLGELWRAALDYRTAARELRAEEHRFETAGAFASLELASELREASSVDPLAPRLLRWVQAMHLEHGTLELRAARERALRSERHVVDQPVHGSFTLRELLEAALADERGARAGWLEAFVREGSALQGLEGRLWERRRELSQALGLASPNLDLPGDDAPARAHAILEQLAEARASLGVRDLASLIELGLGRDATATWPGRATPRAIAELLAESVLLRHVSPSLPRSIRVFGAASFMRALWRFGKSLRAALAPERRPFALTRDPFDLPGETSGALFALLPMERSFAHRELDVARARLADHQRVMARVLLFAACRFGFKVALRAPALEGASSLRAAFPALAWQSLGVELSERAAGVLFRPRVADAARLLGLLAASDQASRFTETYDEDYYRNPRAIEELRETARLPPPDAIDPQGSERGAAALVKRITDAL